MIQLEFKESYLGTPHNIDISNLPSEVIQDICIYKVTSINLKCNIKLFLTL